MVDTARDRVEAALRRDATLEAVAFAAQRLLDTPDWEAVIDQILRRLGEAVSVSRAHVFMNQRSDGGGVLSTLVHEWTAPGIRSVMDSPDNREFSYVAGGIESWERILNAGDVVYGSASTLPEGARSLLSAQGVRSTVIVPIHVGDEWWGVIGFNDCLTEREWSQIEIDALRAVAGTIGPAISRQRYERRIRETEERYRVLVEHVPAAMYTEGLDAKAEDFYISPQVVSMFGYSQDEWRSSDTFWVERIHPNDRDRVLEEDSRTNETGEPYSAEYRFLAKDGRYVWVHEDAVLVRNEEGRPQLWQGFMLDITQQKQAEEKLRETEAQFRAVIEQNPVVVYTQAIDEVDPAITNTVFISPQAEAMLGYSVDEVLQSPAMWRDQLHPEDRERVLAEDARGNITGDDFSMEYRVIARDGRVVWVHDEAKVVRDESGRPRSWQGFMLDITERKRIERQLKEREAAYRDLFENANDLIYTYDPDGNITSVNRAAERLLGFQRHQILGTNFERFVPPEHLPIARAMLARTLSGLPTPAYEIDVVAKDGGRIPLEVNTRLITSEGRPVGVQGAARDITERRRAEQELEWALEVEREASRRLRSLDDMKNTFLQAVSHDLRTPLAAILGLAITLERRDLPLESEEIRDLAARIAVNARKLDRLVNDLLDLDRLVRGIVTPKLASTDVGALAQRVVSESDVIGTRDVQLHVETVRVEVDPAKVERIVENLLSNTARHTPVGSRVWVRVLAEEGGVLIAVEDDGPGIAEEHRKGIFEPFRQGPGASAYSPGVGVGLALVSRFAELHGGRAWVEGREGGGASFRVFLPDGGRKRGSGSVTAPGAR